MKNNIEIIDGKIFKGKQGYIYGLKYPCLLVKIKVHNVDLDTCHRVKKILISLLSAKNEYISGIDVPKNKNIKELANYLSSSIQAAHQSVGLPIYQKSKVVNIDNNRVLFAVPTMLYAKTSMSKFIHVFINAFNGNTKLQSTACLEKKLKVSLDELQASTLIHPITALFIKESVSKGVSFRLLPGGICQFGSGHFLHKMKISFTQNTSAIAAGLAKNKLQTSQYISLAGLPIAEGARVVTENEAVRVADKMGYPVVVKPFMLDGGKGVHVFLQDEKSVRKAFRKTSKLTNEIIVEKHFFGKDYRIYVFKNQVIWVVERQPAGVVGNGVNTIQDLVSHINLNPKRGKDKRSPLKQIIIDDESISLLQDLGLALSSVPEKGQFIPLKRIANIAAGGMPIAVMDKVHPDNVRLAIRAASILGLDLAGIDFLTSNIEKSWLEAGGVICEVNSQPDLGQTTSLHLYGPILESLLTNRGRIPTVLVLSSDDTLVKNVENALLQKNINVGVVDFQGVRVGGKNAGLSRDSFNGSIMLEIDPTVEAIVIHDYDSLIKANGLPLQRIDALIIESKVKDGGAVDQEHDKLIAGFVYSIAAHCDGYIVGNNSCSVNFDILKHFTSAYSEKLDSERVPFEYVIERLFD